MKNAETTLDSLSVLCLDGKIEESEDGNHIIIKKIITYLKVFQILKI